VSVDKSQLQGNSLSTSLFNSAQLSMVIGGFLHSFLSSILILKSILFLLVVCSFIVSRSNKLFLIFRNYLFNTQWWLSAWNSEYRNFIMKKKIIYFSANEWTIGKCFLASLKNTKLNFSIRKNYHSSLAPLLYLFHHTTS
jgi:hypothetical protein